jgi:hypothetical protein
MKAKSSARRVSSRKSKARSRQPIKSSWKRGSALQDTMRIVLPKENPYREGTGRYNAFEALRAGKTVGKALSDTFAKGKNGTTRNERRFLLRTMVHEGLARVA